MRNSVAGMLVLTALVFTNPGKLCAQGIRPDGLPAIRPAIGGAIAVELDDEEDRPDPPPLPTAAPLPEGPPPTSAEIREMIAALGNERYEVREAATRSLESAGIGAVEPLGEVALGDNLEVTCRAVRGLEGIAHTGDLEAFEAAQSMLERLAESKQRSAARRAATAVAGLGDVRRKQSQARILRLGGIIKPPLRIRGILPADGEEDTGPVQVVLNHRWKGGDSGLMYVRRLETMTALVITRSAEKMVSKEAIANLQRALPNLRIDYRGDAMLGVSCVGEGMICRVENVAEGSAAERAGVRPGDILLRYDGIELRDFKLLAEITGRHNIGDKVSLEIGRDGDSITVEVQLDEWK